MKEIAMAIAAFFGFLTKSVPSDKIRETRLEVHLPRLNSNERLKLLKTAYNYLKKRPEVDVANHVHFTYDVLAPEDQEQLIQELTERLNATPIYNRKKAKQHD